jgi:hypothetical protein
MSATCHLPVRILAQIGSFALLRNGFLAEAYAATGIGLQHRHLYLAPHGKAFPRSASRSRPVSDNGMRPVRPGDRNTNTPNRS